MQENESDKIRVMLAEDNMLTRLGTLTLLETQACFEVVGEAEDGPRAVALFDETRPDVALVDLKMPGFDGVEVTRQIVSAQPGARILILTHYEGDEDIFEALKAGACGYVTKEIRGELLIEALKQVAQGDTCLPNLLNG